MFFNKSFKNLSVFAVFSVFLCTAFSAESADYKEGIHYRLVKKSHPVATKEVIEFLWYGCATCYAIQGELKHWLKDKPTNVRYVRMPAVTDVKMEYFARVLLTAEQLKVLEKIHIPLFTALHAYHRPLSEVNELQRFFSEYGVSEKSFQVVYNSAFITAKVNSAKRLAKDFAVSGAPSFVVNGHYLVDPTMVSSVEELFDVIDFLLQH